MSQTEHPRHPMPPRAARGGPLRVDSTSDADTYLLVLHGECDLSTVDQLRDAFDRALRSPCPEVVVDLEFCAFIDSIGIRSLLGLDRRVRQTPGRELRILPGPRSVQRIFEISGLVDVLPFDREWSPDRAAG